MNRLKVYQGAKSFAHSVIEFNGQKLFCYFNEVFLIKDVDDVCIYHIKLEKLSFKDAFFGKVKYKLFSKEQGYLGSLSIEGLVFKKLNLMVNDKLNQKTYFMKNMKTYDEMFEKIDCKYAKGLVSIELFCGDNVDLAIVLLLIAWYRGYYKAVY